MATFVPPLSKLYNDFVNQINRLMVKPIGSNNMVHDVVEGDDKRNLNSTQFLAKIKRLMNPQVKYPDVIYNEFNRLKNEKNPDWQDLDILYTNVKKLQKLVTSKQVRMEFVEGKYISNLFDGDNYTADLNLEEMKKMINRQLNNIKLSYHSLSKRWKLEYLLDNRIKLERNSLHRSKEVILSISNLSIFFK